MHILRTNDMYWVVSGLHASLFFFAISQLSRPVQKNKRLVPSFKPSTSRSYTWQIRPQDHGVLPENVEVFIANANYILDWRKISI